MISHPKKNSGSYGNMRTLVLIIVSGLGALALLLPLRAGAVSDDTRVRREYADIYERIRRGDQAVEQGDLTFASNHYVGAYVRLLRLQQRMPQWESNLVQFRVEYLRKLLAGGLLARTPQVAPHLEAITNLPISIQADSSFTAADGAVTMTGHVRMAYVRVLLRAEQLTMPGPARSPLSDIVGVATGAVRLCVLNTQNPVTSNAMILARGDCLVWRTNGMMELSGVPHVLMSHGGVAARMRGLRYDPRANQVGFEQMELTATVPEEELRTLAFDDPVQEQQ
jgi:hypothetical protein